MQLQVYPDLSLVPSLQLLICLKEAPCVCTQYEAPFVLDTHLQQGIQLFIKSFRKDQSLFYLVITTRKIRTNHLVITVKDYHIEVSTNGHYQAETFRIWTRRTSVENKTFPQINVVKSTSRVQRPVDMILDWCALGRIFTIEQVSYQSKSSFSCICCRNHRSI